MHNKCLLTGIKYDDKNSLLSDCYLMVAKDNNGEKWFCNVKYTKN